jgi:hypothetical protein
MRAAGLEKPANAYREMAGYSMSRVEMRCALNSHVLSRLLPLSCEASLRCAGEGHLHLLSLERPRDTTD